MDRDINRNEAFVLGIIDNIGPCTGYEISCEGEEQGRKLGVPTIYAAIDPLSEAGLISREERSISSGEKRSYWRTTEQGTRVLAEQTVEETSAPNKLSPQPAT